MTEEKKDFYEIKKENVKQFVVIVTGAFIGCFMAIFLAGQIIKSKTYHQCHCTYRPHYSFKHHQLKPRDFKRLEHNKYIAQHKIKKLEKNFTPEMKKVETKTQ